MRRTWWEFGIGIAVLLLVVMSVNCTLDVSGLPGMKERPDQENAYTCRCECKLQVQNPTPNPDYTRSLNVCAPFQLNPNVNPARNKTPYRTSRSSLTARTASAKSMQQWPACVRPEV